MRVKDERIIIVHVQGSWSTFIALQIHSHKATSFRLLRHRSLSVHTWLGRFPFVIICHSSFHRKIHFYSSLFAFMKAFCREKKERERKNIKFVQYVVHKKHLHRHEIRQKKKLHQTILCSIAPTSIRLLQTIVCILFMVTQGFLSLRNNN